jgi:hypothetical protein
MFAFLLPSAAARNFTHQGQMPLRQYGENVLPSHGLGEHRILDDRARPIG